MKLIAFGPFHLRTKDKVLLLAAFTLLLFLAPVAGLLPGHGTSVLVFGFMVWLLMIIQIEVYRRVQSDLRMLTEKYVDVTDVLQGRRSVRAFIDEPVKKQDLEKMLETARMAPSGGNTQPWHFIVIQNREIISQMQSSIQKKIDEVSEALVREYDVPAKQIPSLMESLKKTARILEKTPVTIAVLVKFIPGLYYKPCAQYVMEKKGLGFAEAQKYMGSVELLSVGAAIENLLLAAHSLGYGACWLRVPFMAKDELESLLEVRPPRELIALVPVGVPAPEASPPQRERKRIEEITTFL